MMEFTLSRVVLCVCGVAILAAVLAPFLTVMEDGEDERLQSQSDSVASMIDTFCESEADTMTLDMNNILNSPASSISIDGSVLRITYDDKEYVSALRHPVSADDTHYDCNDIVRFVKSDGMVISEVVN